MFKKICAVLLIFFIAFLWFVTLKGIGPIDPIQKGMKLGLDISGGVYVVMEAQVQDIKDQAEVDRLMQETQSIIERRVNEMGLSEPVVTIEGKNRIRVELPGASNAEDAINAIGKTAQLKFSLADGTEVLSGTDIKDSGIDTNKNTGGYVVTLKFSKEGGEKFYEATKTAYENGITSSAIKKVLSPKAAEDSTDEDVWTFDPVKEVTAPAIAGNSIVITLDNQVISAPGVKNGPIDGTEAIIEGTFTRDEAEELSMLIRGGALPVELKEVQTSSIGATLGMDALKNSLLAGVIGVGLILLLLLVMYRLPGLAAGVALLFYIPIVMWILVLFKAVLTLPGIAGIILSIGMAVDANVIIFARIKEEVGNGRSIRVASREGFKRALSTIVDSQLTTLIAALVLYQFGTGPVRGFALTLMIGILVSLFTALLITNLFMSTMVDIKFLAKPGLLGVPKYVEGKAWKPRFHFRFVARRKVFYLVTVVLLVVGISVGFVRGFNPGIDFTGGTVMQFDMGKTVSVKDIEKTLKANGIEDADVVHFGDKNEGVIIKMTQSLDNKARSEFEKNFFETYDLEPSAEQTFEQFGPSVGDILKQNAITAILIAAFGMLLYIIVRFKWRFGVAALSSVIHDVLMMVAFYGLFRMTINNPFIAAILTVVGYSINDTIVIFDRIRENLGIMNRRPLDEIVDSSINQTLVRSLMTSVTTLLAILPLVILGGTTIRQFAVPLMIGILCGACSSIFVASPLFFDLNRIGASSGRKRTMKLTSSDTEAKGKKAKGMQENSVESTEESEAKPEQTTPASGKSAKGKKKQSKSKRTSSKTGGAVV
ncbi:MAG: protein translocase subunit SecD [Clostridiales Family XIII bacterium]|jgi:SecD/SecF fusion protein|nr:protein translocase subunit SecD [Clostridiales Family XIII bacterium]